MRSSVSHQEHEVGAAARVVAVEHGRGVRGGRVRIDVAAAEQMVGGAPADHAGEREEQQRGYQHEPGPCGGEA
jgi:hypothetical protein